jgi:hypothetical protein
MQLSIKKQTENLSNKQQHESTENTQQINEETSQEFKQNQAKK